MRGGGKVQGEGQGVRGGARHEGRGQGARGGARREGRRQAYLYLVSIGSHIISLTSIPSVRNLPWVRGGVSGYGGVMSSDVSK